MENSKIVINEVELINIDISSWIQVDKNDLKIGQFDENGIFQYLDVKNLKAEKVVKLLNSGKYILESFIGTYNDAIDGEDNFEFSVEED